MKKPNPKLIIAIFQLIYVDRSCMPQEPPAPDVPSPRLPGVSQRHRGWRKVRIFAVLDVKTNILEVSLLLNKYDRGSLLRKRMTRSYIFFMFSQVNNKLMFLATFLLPTRPQWSQVSTSQMLKQNKSDKTHLAPLQWCLHVQYISKPDKTPNNLKIKKTFCKKIFENQFLKILQRRWLLG